MGTTTFSGPVVSQQGFQAAPVELADANATIDVATHNGKVLAVPNLAGNRTFTLTDPTGPGISYKFIANFVSTETENVIITTETDDNSVFFSGGLAFHDSDATGPTSSSVFADGDSNNILTLTDPGVFEVNIVSLSETEWFVWGSVVSVTAPAFTD